VIKATAPESTSFACLCENQWASPKLSARSRKGKRLEDAVLEEIPG
jgi:hypothetical protein